MTNAERFGRRIGKLEERIAILEERVADLIESHNSRMVVTGLPENVAVTNELKRGLGMPKPTGRYPQRIETGEPE